MRKSGIAAIAVPLLFLGATTVQADAHMEAAKATFAERCEDCHYEDDFAGTPKADIKAMIKAVASGETEHDDSADLSGLSDADIDALAGYFASFE
jgi:cytochrome c553